MTSPLFNFDKQQAICTECDFIIGVDEAGRGPLAGPVVACACFIPPAAAADFTDVNDSKKLTEKKREELFKRLQMSDAAFGVGFASAVEIDRLNILQATFLAMRRAIKKFEHIPNSVLLVDGPYPISGLEAKQQPIIDGDAKSLAIAAASSTMPVTTDTCSTSSGRWFFSTSAMLTAITATPPSLSISSPMVTARICA